MAIARIYNTCYLYPNAYVILHIFSKVFICQNSILITFKDNRCKLTKCALWSIFETEIYLILHMLYSKKLKNDLFTITYSFEATLTVHTNTYVYFQNGIFPIIQN